MKWLETHKHLAITLVVAAVCLFIAVKVMAHLDGVAHDQRVLAEEKLRQDQSAQHAAEAQAAIDRQESDRIQAEMARQNAALRSQNAVLMSALSARQQQDRQLPPSELATRWEGLIGAAPGAIKPLPEGLLAPLPAAQETVVRLEEVPALRQGNKNLEGIIANDAATQATLLKRATSADNALAACKQTQESMQKACDLRVKDEVAKANKRGWLRSLGAFIGGIILRSKI